MKLAVFGATGLIGQQVVQQALDRNITVTAYVRNSQVLDHLKSNSNLKLVNCNILNNKTFSDTLPSHDAVISCLGYRGLPILPITFYTDSCKSVLEAVKSANISRYICISSGFSKPNDTSYPFFLYRMLMRPMIGRHLDDLFNMEQFVEKQPDLEYTIVRPTRLSNDTPTNDVQICAEESYYITAPDCCHKIPRYQVAKFMLDELDKREWVRKGVSIDIKK